MYTIYIVEKNGEFHLPGANVSYERAKEVVLDAESRGYTFVQAGFDLYCLPRY